MQLPVTVYITDKEDFITFLSEAKATSLIVFPDCTEHTFSINVTPKNYLNAIEQKF